MSITNSDKKVIELRHHFTFLCSLIGVILQIPYVIIFYAIKSLHKDYMMSQTTKAYFPALTFPYYTFLFLFFFYRHPKTEIDYCWKKLWKVEPNRDQKWWWGEIQLCRQGSSNSIFNQLEKKCKIIYILKSFDNLRCTKGILWLWKY